MIEPAHSPLGGSGAERWMNCPGSAALAKALAPKEAEEPLYRLEGSAAHDLGEEALRSGRDAWEYVNGAFRGVVVTAEMAEAVQTYLDYCRPQLADPTWDCWIEDPIGGENRPHPLFYGTVDFASLGTEGDRASLKVTDYKHGEGIAVEVKENAQMMYYAYGIVLSKCVYDAAEVLLTIVQPRAFHPHGPIRHWRTTAKVIREWGENVLIPAMVEAEKSNRFSAGKWCRFCPAKLACPMLSGMFGAASKADVGELKRLDNDRLGLEYQQIEAVKMYLKAIEAEVLDRLSDGYEVGGTKLVSKRSIRVFKKGAEDALVAEFGRDAYTTPQLKSPADIDKLGSRGKTMTKEWGYSPDTGLTVALASDPKTGIKPTKSDVFASFAWGEVDNPPTD